MNNQWKRRILCDAPFQVLTYLRPFPVPLLVPALLLVPVERLSLELPTRLELPVPLVLLLLVELFTRLPELVLPVRELELVVVPLGRLVLLGRLTLPLLPVRPLLLPLPEGVLGLTLLLEPPLLGALVTEPIEVPLLALPWLMLPPLAFGLTVAVGAGASLLGFSSGLLFQSWVAG